MLRCGVCARTVKEQENVPCQAEQAWEDKKGVESL